MKISDSSDRFPHKISRPLPSPFWVPDQLCQYCNKCGIKFSITNRRHHCRGCGKVFCNDCSKFRHDLKMLGYNQAVESKLRVCEDCFHKYNIVNPFEILQAVIRIKIASYLPPKSICKLSIIDREWYRILTSEEADKLLWSSYVQTNISPTNSKRNLSVSETAEYFNNYGRSWFNSYISSFVVKQSITTSVIFLRWPIRTIREEAAEYIVKMTSTSRDNRMLLEKLHTIELIIKLLNYYSDKTGKSMLSNNYISSINIKFIELLLGIIMNITQDVNEQYNPIIKYNGIPLILRYLSSSSYKINRYQQIVLFSLGCLLNITNSDPQSSILIGQYGGISILLKILNCENENIRLRTSSVLGNLIRRVKENQEEFKENDGIKMLLTIIENVKLESNLLIYLKTIRNCCYQNPTNQIELRLNNGIKPLLYILYESRNSQVLEVVITTLNYCVSGDKECYKILIEEKISSKIIVLLSTESEFFCEKAWNILNIIIKNKTELSNIDFSLIIQKIQKYTNNKSNIQSINNAISLLYSLYINSIYLYFILEYITRDSDNFELIKSILEDINSNLSEQSKNYINQIIYNNL